MVRVCRASQFVTGCSLSLWALCMIVISTCFIPYCFLDHQASASRFNMGIKVLEVLFTGDQYVYKPGDSLSGEVRIVCDKKEDVRCIKLNFVGQSYTHWTETHGSGEHRETIHCTTDFHFFNEEVIVRGAGKDKGTADRITLDGEHRFPFHFQIPNISLPPPFEGFYGYVRYYVKVTIDRPWKFDQHTEKFFSILTVKDLNYETNVLVPPSHQVEKTVCCLCCASGPIVLKGMIDKRGYVPGEYIFVSVDLHNNSSRTINRITVTLKQTSYYTAYSHYRIHHEYHTNKVAELKLGGCEALGSVTHDRIKLLVPPVPPCTFENCPNIKIEYHVEIEAGISMTPMNTSLEHPIMIGTVPAFQHTLKTPHADPRAGIPGAHAPSAEATTQPLPGQVQSAIPLPGQPDFPRAEPPQMVQEADRTAPPPTYETAVGGPHEMERTEGSFSSIMYAPQYPYYDSDALYAAMGIPEGTLGPSADEGHPSPTVTQPQSIQHPTYNS